MLELNAHPERLDLLDTYCRMARDEGVWSALAPTCTALEFDNLKYGIGQAQRGWLSKDDVLNTRPLSELKRLFAQRPGVIFGAARMAAHRTERRRIVRVQMRFVAVTAAAATLLCLPVPAATAEEKPMSLTITSTAFSPNGAIPALYTCEGKDVSPPLAWSGVPAGTRRLALIVDDPDAPDPAAPRMTWVHWVLYSLPTTTTGLAEAIKSGALPSGTREGVSDFGRTGYGGPCPPVGRHRYFHKLYALDIVLSDLKRPDKAALEKAMEGHILAQAVLIGTYQKGW